MHRALVLLTVAGVLASRPAAAIARPGAKPAALKAYNLQPKVERWASTFERHDPGQLLALYADNAVFAAIAPTGWSSDPGREAKAKALAALFEAFPDARLTVNRGLERSDLVIVEWTLQGTNSGPYRAAPPTGKKVSLRGISLLWFDPSGLITRDETVLDHTTISRQLTAGGGADAALEPEAPPAKPVWVRAHGSREELALAARARNSWPRSWNEHDRKGYGDLLTDDAVHVELASAAETRGRAANVAELERFARTLPDMQTTVQEVWAFGDGIAVMRFKLQGTTNSAPAALGPGGPPPPARRPIVIDGIDVDEFRQNKLARAVTYTNGEELSAQLGATPPPPAAGERIPADLSPEPPSLPPPARPGSSPPPTTPSTLSEPPPRNDKP